MSNPETETEQIRNLVEIRAASEDTSTGRSTFVNPFGYQLSLGDGTKWFLTCERELRPWLDQLAVIFRLKPGWSQGARQLRFLASDETGNARAGFSNSPPGCASASKDDEGWRWSWGMQPSSREWWSSSGPDFVYTLPSAAMHYAECLILFTWNALGPIHLRAILGGGLPFHAALAELDGKGILFAAKGAIGKSTCSRRLPPPWKSWCDDQVLVVRHPDQGYRAHPFPTQSDYLNGGSTKTWPAEHHVPLSAIFFLERETEDSVIPLGAGETVVRICQSVKQIMGVFWDGMPHEQKRRVATQAFDNACVIAKAVPAFRLRVTLAGHFWEKVEKALEAKGQASCQTV